MDEELASLLENSGWTLEQQPVGFKPIAVKWVFKIRRDAAGHIERYKARLVAKGFMPKTGVDYNEALAPSTPLLGLCRHWRQQKTWRYTSWTSN